MFYFTTVRLRPHTHFVFSWMFILFLCVQVSAEQSNAHVDDDHCESSRHCGVFVRCVAIIVMKGTNKIVTEVVVAICQYTTDSCSTNLSSCYCCCFAVQGRGYKQPYKVKTVKGERGERKKRSEWRVECTKCMLLIVKQHRFYSRDRWIP